MSDKPASSDSSFLSFEGCFPYFRKTNRLINYTFSFLNVEISALDSAHHAGLFRAILLWFLLFLFSFFATYLLIWFISCWMFHGKLCYRWCKINCTYKHWTFFPGKPYCTLCQETCQGVLSFGSLVGNIATLTK